ncbi:MAG: Ig-like domain repeat protein [Thermoguttaceae bacterium]
MSPRFSAITRFLRPQQFTGGHRSAKSAVKGKRKNRSRTLQLQPLEHRIVLTAYMVTTTADIGAGSLRDAITQINADTNHALYSSPSNPSVDEIDFNITAASDTGGGFNPATGVATITPQSPLPTITDAVTIDGWSQPGFAGTPLIEIDGSQAGSDGLVITAGNTTVRGLVINSFAGNGVDFYTQGGDVLEGCYIGTNAAGTAALANDDNGIVITSSGNTIGGTTAADRNVISGNGNGGSSAYVYFGIVITGSNASGNVVEANYIGTDATGETPIANSSGGILVSGGAQDNRIGTDGSGVGDEGERNVISGNNLNFVAGITIADTGSSGNIVAGNYIGTNATGTQSLPNSGGGISIGADGNYIGTEGPDGPIGPDTRNVISGNDWAGIQLGGNNNVVAGNFIGTDPTGMNGNGNAAYGIIMFGAEDNQIGTNGDGVNDAAEENVISGNTFVDIFLDDASAFNVIAGNLIGTDVTGTHSLGANFAGIELVHGSHDNSIGGTGGGVADTVDRNVISGHNNYGIYSAGAYGNTIAGNLIGATISGLEPLANGFDIGIFGGGDNHIEQNLVKGIDIDGTASTGNVVAGNLIGTDITGEAVLGSGSPGGVDISNGASNNTIGGTTAAAGNTIAFNSGDGVDVDSGTGNSILGNSIFSNGSPGILLNSANNANNNQAAPVLTAATSSAGGTTISGTLVSVATTTFRVEFFANATPDPTGFGQGQTYLGFATVTTNGSGNASFTATGLAVLPAGQNYLSATATNLSTGDTSQFAQDLLVTPTTTTVTSSMNPSFLGQSVTFTATVAASTSGAGTPTGSVVFVDTTTGVNLGTVTLANGSATLSTSSLAVGANTITASYSGGSTVAGTYEVDFLPSSGSLTQTLSPTILILDPTAGGALSLSGNASINTSGNVVVDSNSASALLASGNASVTAASVQVVGSVSKSGNAKVTKTGSPTTTSDPFASLSIPVASTLGLSSQGSVSLSGNSSQTINPGIYSQITVSGNASLTFNPGIYIIAGGGFTVSGNANVTGSGVTIYNTASSYNPATGNDGAGGTYGSITLSGNGNYKIAAPTTGSYAGILLFQDRNPNDTRALSLSGNAMSGTSGTIYAPKAQLVLSGNAQLKDTLVVDTLSISGNAIAQLVAASGGTVYTPAQIRTAYGINNLALDGTGQTIAIVDAYDDPQIYQALDTFDSQFGLTSSGPTMYQQYGAATSFLTVLNQNGQATSLPGTDPVGPGNDNWEVETTVDVQWAHSMAPGAQIVLVEANSQSLADLMAAAATAAKQPGVSVVSMSWGFAEGQGVLAADEAKYDSSFAVPGVTFVASTGDYGAAAPVYPAFSPNVLAVGGTSLSLNADNSYNGEAGWGYTSAALGTFIGSGGGISQYESEPAYQEGVQSTGSRTTPDVSFVADPATGAWIADPYNLGPNNPWEVVGGTSLSAPCWSGLIALVDQGRSAAGQPTLNSASPTETQQSLYSLSQNDYHVITSGSNGYSAAAGYNLVTGLGTPVANLLVPDLIAGNFPTTGQVPPASATALVNSGTTGGNAGGTANVMNVFTALTMSGPAESSSPMHDLLARSTNERISKAHDAVLQRQDLATSQNELAWLWGWTGFQEQRHSSGVPDGFASAVDKVLELS